MRAVAEKSCLFLRLEEGTHRKSPRLLQRREPFARQSRGDLIRRAAQLSKCALTTKTNSRGTSGGPWAAPATCHGAVRDQSPRLRCEVWLSIRCRSAFFFCFLAGGVCWSLICWELRRWETWRRTIAQDEDVYIWRPVTLRHYPLQAIIPRVKWLSCVVIKRRDRNLAC